MHPVIQYAEKVVERREADQAKLERLGLDTFPPPQHPGPRASSADTARAAGIDGCATCQMTSLQKLIAAGNSPVIGRLPTADIELNQLVPWLAAWRRDGFR